MSSDDRSFPAAAHRAQFPKAATIGVVEEILSNGFAKNPKEKPLELDFSKSEFIEVVTLVFILALMRDRSRSGFNTILKLPDQKRARDFLRVWDFPAAVSSATGQPFREIACKEEDAGYFGENKSPSDNLYQKAYKLREDAIRQMSSNRFFALQCFELRRERPVSSLVLEESSRWSSQLVKSVLAKHLRGPEGYLSSRIVFEAMTNALRHSCASMIVSSSMFDEPSALLSNSDITETNELLEKLTTDDSNSVSTYLWKQFSPITKAKLSKLPEKQKALVLTEAINTVLQSAPIYDELRFASVELRNETLALMSKKPLGHDLIHLNRMLLEDAYPQHLQKKYKDGFFTIVYWDDGESMVDTLRRAIREGKRIRLASVPVGPDEFHVYRHEMHGEKTQEVIISSHFEPNKDTPDWQLLLATTFPGITRDIESKSHASDELKSAHPEYDAPGMGLYVLLNTVIDVFKGSLTFRTKEFMMSLKGQKEEGKGKYNARIKEFPPSSPAFKGNMLTIRLPLKLFHA